MKRIHFFKIAQDSKKFDMVEMLYDDIEQEYLVRWKWTTMKTFAVITFKLFLDAEEKYKERQHFAIICNSLN